MKLVKQIGAAFFLLLALSQTLPIYMISWGLLLGQGGDETAYFAGKLLGHCVVAILLALIAAKLYRSAKNSNVHDA